MTKLSQLSICSILKNEQRFLPAFLEMVLPYCDELVLVDTGSTDRSLEILKERKIQWHSFQWIHDFSKARNYSLSLAQMPWIMVLDIDDRISPQSFLKIREQIQSTDSDGIYLSYNHLEKDDWQTPCPSIKDIQARLMIFRNHLGYIYRNPIHETIDTVIREKGGKLEHWNLPIYHLGYIEDMVGEKDERNRDLILKNYRKNPHIPLNIYNYSTLSWGKDPSILKDLKGAFPNAEPSLQYAIAERILAWLENFQPQDHSQQNQWEQRLLSLDPNAPFIHLRKGRTAFSEQNLDQALHSYRQVASRLIYEDLRPEVARETLDRLSVLEAMSGNFTKALEYIEDFEKRFLRNAGTFHLRLKLLFASKRFDKFVEYAQNPPQDLPSLEPNKVQEITTMIRNLPESHQKHEILAGFQKLIPRNEN